MEGENEEEIAVVGGKDGRDDADQPLPGAGAGERENERA